MITDFFLYIVALSVGKIINFLPLATSGDNIGSGMATVAYYAQQANVFFPVDTMILCFATLSTAIFLFVTYRIVRFGLSLIPFIG